MANSRDKDKNKLPEFGRRGFMAGVAVAAGAGVTGAAKGAPMARPAVSGKAKPPSAVQIAAETQPPAAADPLTVGRTASDQMVDVLKALDIDYIAANPGSSFRGLHESIINYGGNKAPEFLTCCHEESSVGIAHGYAKAAGKPMAVLLHATVGVQHAAMAIYNAFCDRVPVVMIAGNSADAEKRRPGIEWDHSVQDGASLVRDFTKWDDQPQSLGHFEESLIRAYKIATTPPMAPVMIVADTELQEEPIGDAKRRLPKIAAVRPPAGDPNAVREAARMLANAQNPVIVVDRYARTPAAMPMLIELAEAVQAPVCDLGSRMNFPNTHYLNQSDRRVQLVAQADLILAIEPIDLWGVLNRFREQPHRVASSAIKPDTKVINIGLNDFMAKSNYQDMQRYPEIDLNIAGDGEATMPVLVEAVKQAASADKKSAYLARGEKMKAVFAELREEALRDAAYGWNASPITTARMFAELHAPVKDLDWSLACSTGLQGRWPQRLWKMDNPYAHFGNAGGFGIGYGAPSAVGIALANKEHGRFSINVQGDGDLMYAPGILWTAVHHKIPLLTLVHNNRGYHQEIMHVQRMANRHNRGIERAHIGTMLDAPFIDYATLAKSMGMWSAGPISDPDDLGKVLRRAVDVVKQGEPALVDVVSQPR